MLNSNQQYDQYQVNNPQLNQSYINQAIQLSLYSTQLSMSNYKRTVEFDYLNVKKYSDKKIVEFVYKSGNKTEHDIQNKITKDKSNQKVSINIKGFNIVVPQYIARLIK